MDGSRPVTMRDSFYVPIFEGNKVFVRSSYYYPTDYTGKVQNISIERSGGRTFAELQIKSKGTIHKIDIGLNNELTPYNRNYTNPTVIVQNLSVNERKLGTTIMQRLFDSPIRRRSRSRSRSPRRRSRSRSPRRRSRSRSPNPIDM